MPYYDVMVHDNKVIRYRLEAASPEAARDVVEALTGPVETPDEVDEEDIVRAEWYIDEVVEIREPDNEPG